MGAAGAIECFRGATITTSPTADEPCRALAIEMGATTCGRRGAHEKPTHGARAPAKGHARQSGHTRTDGTGGAAWRAPKMMHGAACQAGRRQRASTQQGSGSRAGGNETAQTSAPRTNTLAGAGSKRGAPSSRLFSLGLRARRQLICPRALLRSASLFDGCARARDRPTADRPAPLKRTTTHNQRERASTSPAPSGPPHAGARASAAPACPPP